MPEQNSCVAIYDLCQQVAGALDALRRHDCDLRRVSVVGRGGYSVRQPFAFHDSVDGVRFYGEQGDFWNRTVGMLGSAACFWAPGDGPLVATGSIVAVMADRSERLAISGRLDVLGRALYTLGVSGESARRYESMVSAGRLLLVVQGDRPEVEHASDAIAGTDGAEMAVYAA